MQRRLNPNMKEVVKGEVLKLLDPGIIYPISDSKWVSPTQVVPKKSGVTVVENDKGELVAVVQGHLEDTQARAVSMFIDVTEVRDLLISKHLAKIAPPKETTLPKEVEPTSDQEKVKSEEDTAAKKERDAARQLKYVKEFVTDGKKDLARSHCHEIIEKYGGTKAAKEAQELLEKLKE